jgi:hypothetical protein
MLLTMSVILLVTGLWAAWIGLKACEQVYGIALLLTGVLVVIWSLLIAPLWFQIIVEFLLLGLSQFVANQYVNWRKARLKKRCYR